MSLADLMGVVTFALALSEFAILIAMSYAWKYLKLMWREMKDLVHELDAIVLDLQPGGTQANTTALANALSGLRELASTETSAQSQQKGNEEK
jgi:hypothetical protein